LEFKIHKSRDCSDVYEKVEEWLLKDIKMNPSKQDYKLMFKNQVLGKNISMEKAEINHNCSLYALIEEKEKVKLRDLEDEKNEEKENHDLNAVNQKLNAISLSKLPKASPEEKVEKLNLDLAPMDRVPKAPKDGYKVSPSMQELSRMTISELAKVEDFTISNKHGRI
jgi:hypothetical protein